MACRGIHGQKCAIESCFESHWQSVGDEILVRNEDCLDLFHLIVHLGGLIPKEVHLEVHHSHPRKVHKDIEHKNSMQVRSHCK